MIAWHTGQIVFLVATEGLKGRTGRYQWHIMSHRLVSKVVLGAGAVPVRAALSMNSKNQYRADAAAAIAK